MIDVGGFKRDVARAVAGGARGIRVRIDIQEAKERQLGQVAQAIEEATAKFQKGAPAKATQADHEGRAQRPRLGLRHRHTQLRHAFLRGATA